MNLTVYHDDFMKNHEIVHFHGIEQMEMENMRATMYELATVSDINETNQTDSIASWAFTLKSPTYADLKRTDIIMEKRTQNDVRTLTFKAYRKTPHNEKIGNDEIKGLKRRMDLWPPLSNAWHQQPKMKNNPNNNHQKQ